MGWAESLPTAVHEADVGLPSAWPVCTYPAVPPAHPCSQAWSTQMCLLEPPKTHPPRFHLRVLRRPGRWERPSSVQLCSGD